MYVLLCNSISIWIYGIFLYEIGFVFKTDFCKWRRRVDCGKLEGFIRFLWVGLVQSFCMVWWMDSPLLMLCLLHWNCYVILSYLDVVSSFDCFAGWFCCCCTEWWFTIAIGRFVGIVIAGSFDWWVIAGLHNLDWCHIDVFVVWRRRADCRIIFGFVSFGFLDNS